MMCLKSRVLGLFLAFCMVLPVLAAVPGTVSAATPTPPSTMTAWTIANHSHASDAWCNYADSDTLTINAGGEFHFDIGWAGADGSRDTSAITVNAGGILVIDAGVRLDVNTGQAITVAEGGQLLALGTSSSRVTIQGEDTTSATHYIRTATGGKIYCQYTDISGFTYLGVSLAGEIQIINCTVTAKNPLLTVNYAGKITAINCTLTQSGAGEYVIRQGVDITLINCVMTSTTNARLFTGDYIHQLTFAGCTYQGVAIATTDFPLTAQDIDIRIYEASAITSNVAGASWSLSHPYMDSTGMVRDTSKFYMAVPGYLAYGTGNTTIYTLAKFGFWQSGLAVASRTWQNISVSGGSGSMNGVWNFTASKWGYVTNSTTGYSGADLDIHLTAIPAVVDPGLAGQNEILTWGDAGHTLAQANFTWGQQVFGEYILNASATLTGDYTNFTVENATGTTLAWLGNLTLDYIAGIAEGGDFTFWANWTEGTYFIVATIQHPDLPGDTIITTQFAIVNASAGTGTGDFAAVVNIRTYSDNATAIPCNNFTAWADVIINGTIETNGNLTNASVIVTLYNATGYMSELLNVSWNFTLGIAYNITEMNGGTVLFWTANESGRHHVMINVTNASAFYNTTVTEEGFWVAANATAPAAAEVKPMVRLDFEPVVQEVVKAAPDIVLGVILFAVLGVCLFVYRSETSKNHRWRVGSLDVRWKATKRRR